jgi:hypothetical protein
MRAGLHNADRQQNKNNEHRKMENIVKTIAKKRVTLLAGLGLALLVGLPAVLLAHGGATGIPTSSQSLANRTGPLFQS